MSTGANKAMIIFSFYYDYDSRARKVGETRRRIKAGRKEKHLWHWCAVSGWEEGYQAETRGDGPKPVRKYPFDAVWHPVVLRVHVHCQAAIGCIPMGQGYKILERQNELTVPSVAPKSQLLTLWQPPNNSRMKLSALSIFSLYAPPLWLSSCSLVMLVLNLAVNNAFKAQV